MQFEAQQRRLVADHMQERGDRIGHRFELADIALIKLGDESAAIEHLRAMLKLNPNDNQGIRYLLLGCLLRHDDAAAVKTLLAAYKDEWSACWLYTRALVAFQDGHATEKKTYGWCRTPGQPTSTCLAYWLAPSRR